MNREIKFRAREVRTNEWVYFTLEKLVNTGYVFSELKDWCQDTGLKDKNGKEIYEGDIIKCFNHIYVVEFNKESLCYIASDKKVKPFINIIWWSEEPEIIGNVYETPKLLEQDKSTTIDNLTPEQEDKLKEVHSKGYTGTDDDMPEAYENWLEGLTIEEINSIIK